jgi:hypothetical protein
MNIEEICALLPKLIRCRNLLIRIGGEESEIERLEEAFGSLLDELLTVGYLNRPVGAASK